MEIIQPLLWQLKKRSKKSTSITCQVTMYQYIQATYVPCVVASSSHEARAAAAAAAACWLSLGSNCVWKFKVDGQMRRDFPMTHTPWSLNSCCVPPLSVPSLLATTKWGQTSKTCQKIAPKNSWNWLVIVSMPATVWHIFSTKCMQWPETEIMPICWNLLEQNS